MPRQVAGFSLPRHRVPNEEPGEAPALSPVSSIRGFFKPAR
jgi:hypothetical protein